MFAPCGAAIAALKIGDKKNTACETMLLILWPNKSRSTNSNYFSGYKVYAGVSQCRKRRFFLQWALHGGQKQRKRLQCTQARPAESYEAWRRSLRVQASF